MKLYPIIYFLLFLFGGTACDIGKDDPEPNIHGATFYIQIADKEGRDLIDSLRTIGRQTTQATLHITLEKEGANTTRTLHQVTLEDSKPGCISVSQDINFGDVEANLSGRVLLDFQIPALLGLKRKVSVSVNWYVENTDNYRKDIYFTNVTVDGEIIQEETDWQIIIPLTSEGLHLEVP